MQSNIASLFLKNKERYGPHPAFAEKEGGQYRAWTWDQLVDAILASAAEWRERGLLEGDRVVFQAPRSYARLVSEMAVMSLGAISVPVMEGEKDLDSILRSVEPSFTAADPVPLSKSVPSNETVNALLKVDPDSAATLIFTSGTTDSPKGVLLSHTNILAQHRAHQSLWNLKSGLSFLSALPWSHVFGGVFERFLAFTAGGCLYLDENNGKDVDGLIENFIRVKPSVFFAVPLLYDRIVQKLKSSPHLEKAFFHPALQFIFSAAAPLSQATASFFTERGIPIVCGWGLTETSPSVTLTPPTLNTEEGNAGFAIPGVEIKLGEDAEILVKGPNVMKGYWKDTALTQKTIDAEGWLHTGDTGEITLKGLKLLGRKDRIFKLGNGRKVNPVVWESKIQNACSWVRHVCVAGNGMDLPCAILFVSSDFLIKENLKKIRSELIVLNQSMNRKYEYLNRIVLLQREPNLEKVELTRSLKLKANVVEQNYMGWIKSQKTGDFGEGIWVLDLNEV